DSVPDGGTLGGLFAALLVGCARRLPRRRDGSPSGYGSCGAGAATGAGGWRTSDSDGDAGAVPGATGVFQPSSSAMKSPAPSARSAPTVPSARLSAPRLRPPRVRPPPTEPRAAAGNSISGPATMEETAVPAPSARRFIPMPVDKAPRPPVTQDSPSAPRRPRSSRMVPSWSESLNNAPMLLIV